MPAFQRAALFSRRLSKVRRLSTVASSKLSTGAIAFDIDGVLLRGSELIPQARGALHRIATKEMGGTGSAKLIH